jgi:hypothetical protein
LGKPRNKKYGEVSKTDIRKHANRSERREARQFLKEGAKIIEDGDESELTTFDRLERARKFHDQTLELRDWDT